MNKVFLIGTGRNGSKLLASCLGTGNNVKVYGEAGDDGPNPGWYKELYSGIGNFDDRMVKFKGIREKRFQDDIVYVEKSHLIVPILLGILRNWPDAKFIYLKRNSKQVIRSFLERNWYAKKDMEGEYGKGRLVPISNEEKFLNDMENIEQCCWLFYEYTRMIVEFKEACPNKQFLEIKYSDLIDKDNPNYLKSVFKWCGINDFNEFKVLSCQSKIYGTATEDTPKFKDWAKSWKTIYKAYKTSFEDLTNG